MDDIHLNRVKTIRVVGDVDTINGLEFIVPDSEARISDQWKRGESQTMHFYVVSMQNGLRFPLLGFVLELLHDYGVTLSQLELNAWRILGAFYLGCRILGVMSTSRLFCNFYYIKTHEEFYFLQSRGSPIMTKLLDTNKGWKPLFVKVTNLNGFGVDLQWRVAKIGGNRAPTLSLLEQKEYEK